MLRLCECGPTQPQPNSLYVDTLLKPVFHVCVRVSLQQEHELVRRARTTWRTVSKCNGYRAKGKEVSDGKNREFALGVISHVHDKAMIRPTTRVLTFNPSQRMTNLFFFSILGTW